MAGRLPGSPDLETFWDHLAAGRDLVEEIPAERWDWRAVQGDPREGEFSRSRWGGFTPDVDRFDAAFFGISPREAELMDPQQRLLLEVVWTALEDAGLRPSELAGRRVGVFVGVTNSDYVQVQRAAGRGTDPHTITGAALSVIPNRVSYLLDLRGPSIAVDTACSSSLTAIQQANSALRDGSCELAIAGAVSLILDPSLYVALSKNEMLSEDGRCRAFDSGASGYVRGEGVGAVVLKDLAAAERDGDPVHAVIRGVAVSHNGRTNSLTAPGPDAQADVIVRAHRAAGTDPATVGYVEAHGTGTPLGDPIEVTGLKSAFARLYEETGRPVPDGPTCGIGSVKSNVGHLEATAGLAGLFKVVLALRHRTLPASLHVVEQNPYLDLDGSPFTVVTETAPWEQPYDDRGEPLPRRAGLSSFGFGGAGAHLVLEEAPDRGSAAGTGADGGPVLLVLSARTRTALNASAVRLADLLRQESGAPGLADIAYTLQTGRDPMEERLALVAEDRETAAGLLRAFADGDAQPVPGLFHGRIGGGRPKDGSSRSRGRPGSGTSRRSSPSGICTPWPNSGPAASSSTGGCCTRAPNAAGCGSPRTPSHGFGTGSPRRRASTGAVGWRQRGRIRCWTPTCPRSAARSSSSGSPGASSICAITWSAVLRCCPAWSWWRWRARPAGSPARTVCRSPVSRNCRGRRRFPSPGRRVSLCASVSPRSRTAPTAPASRSSPPATTATPNGCTPGESWSPPR